MPKSSTKSAKKAARVPRKDAKPVESELTSSNITVLLRKLSDNDRAVRDKALSIIQRLVSLPAQLSETRVLQLWKGLYLTMWNCDKPITQQKLATSLAALIEDINEVNFWEFTNGFWKIMAREWHNIDSYRINKFYLLVRLSLGAMLRRGLDKGFSEKWIKNFAESLRIAPLEPSDMKLPNGLRLHFADIYLDEIAKLSEDPRELPLEKLLEPVQQFVQATNIKLCRKAMKENVLENDLLVEWGLKEKPVVEAESESDDDWEGFE